MLARTSPGSVISGDIGLVKDAFDRTRDQPQRPHQPQEVDGDENE
jgi:hypothetical protein